MERESFKSRLGFILLSAGCAIGIGNVWRFPYVAGNNGGGIFVLFYLIFLVGIGVPIMTMEFAIGRASRKCGICAYQELEKPGQKWQIHGYVGFVGIYLLMMFYTTVSGWMVSYFFRYLKGEFNGLNPQGVQQVFDSMMAEPLQMGLWTVFIVVLGFAICSLGLQKGVESITKWMMLALLALIMVLVVNSLFLEGGKEGVKFYLYPDFGKLKENGIFRVITAAMNQAFFTLSVGMGSMLIFGSYMGKERSLFGEAIHIAGLDTFVAVAAGLIIFPACFSFGVSPDSGPRLVFVTLPNVFAAMPGGQLWGALFFLFLTFASLSTVVAVFENIICAWMDRWGVGRKKAAWMNMLIVAAASMPCVLGFNLWSGFQPLGPGSTVLDLEDFLVSNVILPGGSLVYLLFCVSRVGWGFENYMAEVNTGAGIKLPKWIRFYVTWILPFIVLFLLLQGLYGTLFG